jgi:hypothetical protein
MTLKKKEEIGNWKRKHWNALCAELDLEGAVDPSYDRIQNNEGET